MKKHRKLNESIYNIFKQYGEGLYYANIEASKENFISKIIGMFSGKYSHSVAILYVEDMREYIVEMYGLEAWSEIRNSIIDYYETPVDIDAITCLVISSADSDGMNCFDFSNYQLRGFTLRKIYCDNNQLNFMLRYLISKISDPYDVAGMLFWWVKFISRDLYKLFDSKYVYCSEEIQEMGMTADIKLANENPSPDEIEEYNAFPLIYKNMEK